MTKLSESFQTTIANGASLSSTAIYTGNRRLIGIQMPAAWTAAALTFQASIDGTTFADLYDKTGAELTVPAAASQCIALDADVFTAWPWLKIRSGTSGQPVNQGAARVITGVARELIG